MGTNKSALHLGIKGVTNQFEQVARGLLKEHAVRHDFHPLAPASGVTNLDAAYEVQRLLVNMLSREAGACAGYKIGLTSRRMQEMCGIDSPLAGIVLANRVCASGTVVAIGQYGRLGLEFEVGVRLWRDLPASAVPFDVRSVTDAVGEVCAAVELVDDRRADYNALDALSIVADNAWNAGAVLGKFTSSWPELGEVRGTVYVNGREDDTGYGRDVLGHPFAPLAWLANHLANRGDFLRSGQIVLTGSLVQTRMPQTRGRFRFELSDIGSVDLAVEA